MSFQFIFTLGSKTTTGCLTTRNYPILACWYKQTLDKLEEILYPREKTFLKGFENLIWFLKLLNETEILRAVACLLEIFMGDSIAKWLGGWGLQSDTAWVQILCDLQQVLNLPVLPFPYLWHAVHCAVVRIS